MQENGLRGACVLKVTMKNKTTDVLRVGVTLKVADDETKNITVPLTQVCDTLIMNDTSILALFLKNDPSKETWGNITIDLQSANKNNKTTTTSSSGSMISTGVATGTSYSGMGPLGGSKSNETSIPYEIGTSTHTESIYDSKIVCANGSCKHPNDYGV